MTGRHKLYPPSVASRHGSRDWVRLRAALTWQYGEAVALNILRGWDSATEADIRAWRGLGKPK